MSLFVSRTRVEVTRSRGASTVAGGRVAISGPIDARRLLAELDLETAATTDSDRPPTAGEIAALALMDEVYQAILSDYLEARDPALLERLLAVLRAQLGLELVDRLLMEFAEEYLGASFRGGVLPTSVGTDAGAEVDRSRTLKHLVIFWLLHSNSAARPIASQLHRSPLLAVPAFRQLVELVSATLQREPVEQEECSGLWELLTLPLRQNPDSLSAQLGALHEVWRETLGFLDARIEAALGMIAEEQAPRFPPGPGPVEIPSFDELEEAVRFSEDRGWMERLVLVAKHTLVWLDQLSTKYKRPIERLDQIPTVELESLRAQGFSGLWLIGVWERSPASAAIKRRTGNPEAAASAYSLLRYSVAAGLGGEEALRELQQRAAAVGIRLAADMVPNHTGLDSDWMLSHPDWFVSQRECPFPAYRFEGPDLSSSPDISIYLEDHYYDRSDAAVVFKRVDRANGDVRFIYHGNDGTSTPWNDTAQLNYLDPRVWEAVIGTIVEVARRFPIIRFDAAMTLTRRHFQRLWFPAPGSAGAIPSRTDHGMSKEEFLERMPHEFWRRVVERLAEEAPDTLLLAEAFWLMEGFFVRTLGMHRVYNSAFMNMLRDGDTAKYRALIKETLAFDPGILKRYVNFMSNPDEATAIEQFGDGDRYFGTCVVLATLPGLPMFGHGQVEGLRERFGMEYRRAYTGELPRSDLVDRHLEQVAPLLGKRENFADVERFQLYDFIAPDGSVAEHVLAYSNGDGPTTTLVLFNNSDTSVRGQLIVSVAAGEQRAVRLGEALGIPGRGYWQCRDICSGRTFVLDGVELFAGGLAIDLKPWESRVYERFEPMELEAEKASRLIARVGLRGSIDLATDLRKLEIEPVIEALRRALPADRLRQMMEHSWDLPDGGDPVPPSQDPSTFPADSLPWLETAEARSELAERWANLSALPELAEKWSASDEPQARRAGELLTAALERSPETRAGLFCWSLLARLTTCVGAESGSRVSDWEIEEWLAPILIEAGGDPEVVGRVVSVAELALGAGWGLEAAPAPEDLELQRQLLADDAVCTVLGAHQFEGREYIHREALETVADWRLILEALAWSGGGEPDAEIAVTVGSWSRALGRMLSDAEAASYRTDELGISAAGTATPMEPSPS